MGAVTPRRSSMVVAEWLHLQQTFRTTARGRVYREKILSIGHPIDAECGGSADLLRTANRRSGAADRSLRLRAWDRQKPAGEGPLRPVRLTSGLAHAGRVTRHTGRFHCSRVDAARTRHGPCCVGTVASPDASPHRSRGRGVRRLLRCTTQRHGWCARSAGAVGWLALGEQGLRERSRRHQGPSSCAGGLAQACRDTGRVSNAMNHHHCTFRGSRLPRRRPYPSQHGLSRGREGT